MYYLFKLSRRKLLLSIKVIIDILIYIKPYQAGAYPSLKIRCQDALILQ